ncbi:MULTISPECIES: hypothetical protein [unclassified Aureimonas]|uniref:hypothetical protein n=1 Tax=unclassified Aureimonas TaxID=2615206 RepID=UPI00070059F1|nr:MULTISPECIES: hypothetical protein [unclassified Aureimonas]KQT55175.1 hypothetical protein ASG62_10020 [Aureimonas sp. Leaf427]KQT70965.1 hypothetical protein ASG54_20405 [Aureimonas sp. Leaf460]
MIANTLIFFLGVLVTALIALILAPVFWRKAQSLARREFEATIPISANEIRAEFDRVRAEAAVSVRRQEVLSAETREKAALAEADRGRAVVEAAELQKRNRRLTQTIEEQDAELEATRAALAEREATIRALIEDLAERDLAADRTAEELEALVARSSELEQTAEEQAIELAAAKAKIEHLDFRLGSPEEAEGEDSRIESLAVEVAGLQHKLRQERAAATVRENRISALTAQLAKADAAAARTSREPTPKKRLAAAGTAKATGEPPRSGSPRFEAVLGRRELSALDPKAEADIRERISDVAARVIRMTALAEGPDSPLASLLAAPASGGASEMAGGKPTLADRVRLLAEAERKTAS